MFERDVDYIVKDDKIELVDMFTGRIMEGRSLSDGLHQAIEAKEGVTITEENKAQAQVTIQNYFRMYPEICGMTGTAKTQEKEFLEVYGMGVIQIPTNRPRIRMDQPDIILKQLIKILSRCSRSKKASHEKGQPILIGTTSILQSEKVAKYLDERRFTFPTTKCENCRTRSRINFSSWSKRTYYRCNKHGWSWNRYRLGEGVAELGGLYVIGTEKHESRRIDNQLRGRSGRQGDPGESPFHHFS